MREIRLLIKALSALGLLGVMLLTQLAEAARLNDIRIWNAPDRTRIVMDLDQAPRFKSFYLANPSRYVVDLPGFALGTRSPDKGKSGPYLKGIRVGKPDHNTARMVLDLKQEVRIKTMLLAPVPGYGHRLVLDVYPKSGAQKNGQTANGAVPPAQAKSSGTSTPPPAPPQKAADEKIIVAIDAGHGGEDPGAIGRRTREKVVTLQIAKRLQKKINAQKGMQAILTRKGDYFVSLRRRTEIAREAGADIFISIHADAYKNSRASGSSVYALSLSGATSEEARWLADKENAADLAGGVNISERDDSVARVLLSLTMDSTEHESILLADSVLGQLKKIGDVHYPKVEKAGFVVLKSPDIPSILIETAYITNRTEEKLLQSARHQEKLANAILLGARNYLKASNYHTAKID